MDAEKVFDMAVREAELLVAMKPVIDEVTKNPVGAAVALYNLQAEVNELKKKVREYENEKRNSVQDKAR